MHASIRLAALAAATLAAASLGACKSNDNASGAGNSAAGATTSMSSTSTTTTDSTHTMSPAALNDSNIVAKMEGGDSAEVALSKVAEKNGSSAVKSYAAMLISDHSKALSDAKALASKTKITPVPPPNDTTAQETAHLAQQWSSLKGTAFDTAFVNHEVEDHQHDIDETNQMISQAQNADVKAELQKDLPVLQKHLDKAKALQSKLTAAPGK